MNYKPYYEAIDYLYSNLQYSNKRQIASLKLNELIEKCKALEEENKRLKEEK